MTPILAKRIYSSHLGGTFSGSRPTLVAILNPHVANWLKGKTASIKRKLARIDELRCYNPNCNVPSEKIKSFDTAHPVDKSRPQAIREAIDLLYPIGENNKDAEIGGCDIAAVFAKTKEIHLAIQITFLCNTCNKNHSSLSTDEIPSKMLSDWIPKIRKKVS